jgi:Tfp pilus assembly protein FimT
MREALSKRRQRGATLLEGMLAVAIAGVLTTAAVPQLANARAQQQLRAEVSDLFAAFNLARSEAARRGSSVAVMAADAMDWGTGWRVFADGNDNGALDPGEEVIVERPTSAAGLRISAHFGATYSGRVLSYTGAGRLHRPGGAGLVIGRLVFSRNGAYRALCFASLGVRMVSAAICDPQP